MSRVRRIAARVLLDVEAGRATLATALDRAQPGVADSRDQALLVEVSAGTLRWQAALDAQIAAASRRPVDGLEPPVRAVLRLGAYQLRRLDRVPPHAIVHEAVAVVRELGRPRAAGFVNAVLRALGRGEGARALPARPSAGAARGDQLAYLSTTLSHPAWLVDRWLSRYGFDATERWCEFNTAPPAITIRPLGSEPIDVLAARIRGEGIAVETAPFVDDALRLPPGSLGRLSREVRAAIRVQDEGSQLVARLAGARPDERVLDLCAAPGGKTLMMAAAMTTPGRVPASLLVAADRRPARLALLAATLASAGVEVPVVGLDATQPLPFGATFDRVLLDAPCSGLGTLRRDPDLKWTRTPRELPALAATERTMLGRAADVIGPGGALVYATCSSEPEENIEVVRAFLAADSRFTPQPFAGADPALLTADGCLTTTPFAHGLDGFFAALLVRRQGA